MNKTTINQLSFGDSINGVYLIKNLQIRKRKSGENFLTMELCDKTGELASNMWDGFDHLDLSNLKFLRVQGSVGTYQDKLQATISAAAHFDENNVDLNDFVPATTKNIDEMLSFIEAKIGQLTNQNLKAMFEHIFKDEHLLAKIKKAPAAKNLHNAYLGGLLEHINDLLQLTDFVTAYYPEINKDLLVSGIILHDIGKVDELNAGTDFNYTDEGKLLGHSILGMEVVDKYSAMVPGFSRELVVQLKHLILSHHGLPEWGSPKPPMTLEAVVLHLLDNLDSKIRGFQQFVDKDNSLSDQWTNRSFMFGNTELFKGNSLG